MSRLNAAPWSNCGIRAAVKLPARFLLRALDTLLHHGGRACSSTRRCEFFATPHVWGNTRESGLTSYTSLQKNYMVAHQKVMFTQSCPHRMHNHTACMRANMCKHAHGLKKSNPLPRAMGQLLPTFDMCVGYLVAGPATCFSVTERRVYRWVPSPLPPPLSVGLSFATRLVMFSKEKKIGHAKIRGCLLTVVGFSSEASEVCSLIFKIWTPQLTLGQWDWGKNPRPWTWRGGYGMVCIYAPCLPCSFIGSYLSTYLSIYRNTAKRRGGGNLMSVSSTMLRANALQLQLTPNNEKKLSWCIQSIVVQWHIHWKSTNLLQFPLSPFSPFFSSSDYSSIHPLMHSVQSSYVPASQSVWFCPPLCPPLPQRANAQNQKKSPNKQKK